MTQKADGDRVAVSIITGFLGSGKTTLIASLLRQPAMLGTAVIVNELGAVGIDDAIIAQSTEETNVLLLKNGCLCCTAGDDLTATLLNLARRSAGSPRQILIETTGLADPVPLLLRLMSDPRLRDAIRLDTLVATVDGLNGLANLDDQPVAASQAGVADRRLITKTDLAEPHQIEALSRRLSELTPELRFALSVMAPFKPRTFSACRSMIPSAAGRVSTAGLTSTATGRKCRSPTQEVVACLGLAAGRRMAGRSAPG